MLTENHFKKFLIDEILRSSNSTVSAAIVEVNLFSETEEFRIYYKKWKVLNTRKKTTDTIRHISECF